MHEVKHANAHIHKCTYTRAHTLVVPRDSEEPPGLSHASCFLLHGTETEDRGGSGETTNEKERKKGGCARKCKRN